MFTLANPWALLLIFMPLLIWFLLPKADYHFAFAIKVPFYEAIKKLVDAKNFSFRQSWRLVLLALIWGLTVFALAGPRVVGKSLPQEQHGRNIMLVLDLSGSMELTDIILNDELVSRLSVVKRAAKTFIKARKGDNLGLILFGTKAYELTPLTFDRASVLERIDDATTGLAGQTTSIGDALGLAVKRLQAVPKESRVVILLTDGANNSGILPPLKAAELAKEENVKVYTIGLGAEIDPRVQANQFYNLNATADLDEPTLKEIAKLTGGRYFKATDLESLQTVYSTISALETVSQEQRIIRPIKEYYIWPLALALLLLLLLVRPSVRGTFSYAN